MALRIEQYGLIGDTQTAALVGDDGSIDWWCAPRFDSAASFAALLGTAENGRWRLGPAGGLRSVSRRYRDDSLVLETTFDTDDGVVRVTDCMPIRKRTVDIVRLVEGVRGAVPVRMDLTIRFDYGTAIPWVRRTEGVLTAVAGPDALCLDTPAPLRGAGMTTVSDFVIREGERVPFVMAWHPSHEVRPTQFDAVRAIHETTRWWRNWASASTYDGPHRDLVTRSLITLKALTYAPTGGIVAAATTSLPEWIGGVRNWDYRFCWLRDATFTLLALMKCGFVDEARAWRDWLLRAAAGIPDDLQIMYGPAGERRLTELELPELPGYEASSPVRIGNAASEQFQLDVFGEVLDALYQAERHAVPSRDDFQGWKLATKLLQFLEHAWHRPDEGIWEVRGGRRHFTHSKVMAWAAFDRAIKAMDALGVRGTLTRWKQTRDEIHAQVCAEAFDPDLGAFVQSYGSKQLDAAALMIPLVGFLPATDPRVRGTVAAIERHLLRDRFVARYDTADGADGLPGGEGAFLPCSFWYVDNLALMGRIDEAHAMFDRLVALANDLGLYAEEYSASAGRQLGNFPQAFTHVCLVNSACNLAACDQGRRGPAHERGDHPVA